MNIKDLLGLTGVPGLDVALELINNTYQTLENVKLYRQQCRDLSDRCVKLMLALRDSSTGLEGLKAIELADEVENIIRRIHNKVNEWASWNRLKSFRQQSDIREGIDKHHRDLDAAMMKFNISITLELTRGHRDLIAIQERDKAELRELLQNIVKSTDDMKTLVSMQSSQPVENIMESLQTELRNPSLEPNQEQSFLEGLWLLHEGTSMLPPMTDLTGQVTRCKENTVAKGTFNDVYMGEWLGREQVALRLPRALANNPDVQRRFQREVTIWRELKHSNVVPLYGIVYIGEDVFSVSPWMDNGTATIYVQKCPNVDRLRILSEVASGLEYLHAKGIVHGDLRGANVLISKDGTARLSDFGLSKFLEDVGQGMTSSPGVNPRWFAPELLRQSGPVSKHSDVWSFAMVCLELMTGEQPFSKMTRDITVMRELDQGKIPERPGSHVTSRGLSDTLWSLMRKCWHKNPESRPSIMTVKMTLSQLRGLSLTPGVSPDPLQRSGTKRSIFSLRRPSTSGSETSVRSLNSGHRLRIPFMTQTSTQIAEEGGVGNSSEGQISPISIRVTDGPLRSPPSVGSGLNLSDGDGGALRLIVTECGSAATPSFRSSSRSSSLSLSPLNISASLPTNFGTHFVHQRTPSSEGHPPSLPSAGSSVSSSSISGPLKQAVTDPTPIFHLTRGGSVAAGTLEGLVERLINHSNLTKDVEYRDILLTTCTDFTTPEDLYAILARRFHEADTNIALHPEQRVAVRYNILVVMKYWLSSHHLQLDPQLLWQMKEFALSALSVETSEIMKSKAKDFLQSIDQRSSQNLQASPNPLSPGRRIPKTSEILPHDLAIALTLLEGDRYRCILPTDYIAHLRHHQGPNNVDSARVVNNKIDFWVKKSILHYNHIESRGNVLKFFVNTAQECRKFRNFASMSAIITALQSAPIACLTLTNNELLPPAKHLLDNLSNVLDPAHDHRAYKAALNETLDSEFKDSCIPWLAVHLHELHLLLRKYPSVVEIDGRPLINFERYVKFTGRIKEILQYKPPDLERYRNQGQLAYLDNQLRGVHLESHSDDDLLERSLALEAEETRSHKKRTRELKSLGFRA